jgi:hypothetical protein
MSFGRLINLAATPAILAVVATLACYAVSGANSLGFYLGPVAMISLILPPLVAGARDRMHVLAIAGGAIDGIGVVWLIAALATSTTLLHWLACYFVLVAYAMALCGLTRILRSGALVTVLALAWLSWPVWASPWVSDAAVAWFTPAHPLMAINHVMLDLGVWTQQRLMYQFTTLGQDVPYTLPRSIWPCVIVHALIAVTALWPARWGASRAEPIPPASASTSEAAAGT